jgi:quinoprotein dehydrogenase-associated probable ABC transporter substrate-binding protein
MVFSDRKLVFALTGFALVFATIADARELRVCADPNNLPFSNERGEGFENKIAELIADELGVTLSYTWWAQRRGFIRNTLNTGSCDLVTGTTNGIEMLRTTLPYYRSGYAFVTRQDGPKVSSLDDPILHNLRIGIQLVGEDGANPPPSEALARRGIVDNVRGYLVYGDYREQNPAAAIMDAVAKGEIDVAIVWGPVAGYFAGRESVPLKVALVTPQNDGPRLPMVFDINMGVRRDDPTLRDEINAALSKLRPKIDAVLANYGVPRADLPVEMQHAPVTDQLSPAP